MNYSQRAKRARKVWIEDVDAGRLTWDQFDKVILPVPATAHRIKDLDANWKPKYDELVKWSQQ